MADVGAALAPADGRGPARAANGDRTWLPSVVLVVGLLVLWEVAALTFLAGSKAVPPLTDVARDIAGDLDVYGQASRSVVRTCRP